MQLQNVVEVTQALFVACMQCAKTLFMVHQSVPRHLHVRFEIEPYVKYLTHPRTSTVGFVLLQVTLGAVEA